MAKIKSIPNPMRRALHTGCPSIASRQVITSVPPYHYDKVAIITYLRCVMHMALCSVMIAYG
jgi:hypothetical protein